MTKLSMSDEFQEQMICDQAIQEAEQTSALEKVALYHQHFVQLAARYAEAPRVLTEIRQRTDDV